MFERAHDLRSVGWLALCFAHVVGGKVAVKSFLFSTNLVPLAHATSPHRFWGPTEPRARIRCFSGTYVAFVVRLRGRALNEVISLK
jgi:hypothetical protein